MKIICAKCDQIAQWLYVPGRHESDGEFDYLCDNCIERGCSCNMVGQ